MALGHKIGFALVQSGMTASRFSLTRPVPTKRIPAVLTQAEQQAVMGLDRVDKMSETEDHIAYLCEVMRYLIADDDVAVTNLTHQRTLLTQQIQLWMMTLCYELKKHPKARFYAALTELTRAFTSVEAQGFDMQDSESA
jgi:TorA maturation chaperone TorD